jgi:hypothetical protein
LPGVFPGAQVEDSSGEFFRHRDDPYLIQRAA